MKKLQIAKKDPLLKECPTCSCSRKGIVVRNCENCKSVYCSNCSKSIVTKACPNCSFKNAKILYSL